MAHAIKRARIEPTSAINAKLKPSEVSQQSNIFGPIKSDSGTTQDNSDEDSSSGTGAADEDGEDDAEDDDDDEDEFDVGAESGDESDGDDDGDEVVPGTDAKKRKKKTDPTDFATAMSKILGNSLTSTARKNPILARSIESKTLDSAALDEKLDLKVRKQMTAEKKAKLNRNHNASVVGTTDEEVARTIERERTLRKTAQRGVVKLFNAIRAAQVSAGDGNASGAGIVVRQGAGVKKREEKAKELSKSSFLDLIKGGSTART